MINILKKSLRQACIPVLLLIDIDPHWPASEIQDRVAEAEVLANSMSAVGHPMHVIYLETQDFPKSFFTYSSRDVIVLNLCDDVPGIPRSCALIAEKLESLGYTFTGTDSQSLVISQDKRQVKSILGTHGIPIPAWQEYSSPEAVAWNIYPAIVKPAFEHCSNGITRDSVVQTRSELINRIRSVITEFNQPVLVEEFIDGREFHVGVIGNDPPCMLPPAEIDYSAFNDIHDRLCTYESNFDKTSLAYRLTAPKFPVDLTPEQLMQLKDVVIPAYQSTHCRDYARMDVRLRDGQFYILDVNPNADISPNTSISLGAEKAGMSYGQFGSYLVNLAARRHPLLQSSNQVLGAFAILGFQI